MKILVTGSAGFIGHKVAIDFAQSGNEVIGVDYLCNGHATLWQKGRLEASGITLMGSESGVDKIYSKTIPNLSLSIVNIENRKKLAAICHDLCKAEHYYFKGRRIIAHRSDSEPKHAHAALSVKRLKAAGIDTPECEELLLAVRMHMHLYSKPKYDGYAKIQQKARKSMLAIAVWGADKLDASRHPAGRLHRDC